MSMELPYSLFEYAMGDSRGRDGFHCFTGEGGSFNSMTIPRAREEIQSGLIYFLNDELSLDAEIVGLDDDDFEERQETLEDWIAETQDAQSESITEILNAHRIRFYVDLACRNDREDGSIDDLSSAAATNDCEEIAAICASMGSIEAHEDMQSIDGNGELPTPLHIAIECHNEQAAQLLIDSGASLNARHIATGYTPLLAAVSRGNCVLVDALLQRSKLSERNRDGLNASEAAREAARELGQFHIASQIESFIEAAALRDALGSQRGLSDQAKTGRARSI